MFVFGTLGARESNIHTGNARRMHAIGLRSGFLHSACAQQLQMRKAFVDAYHHRLINFGSQQGSVSVGLAQSAALFSAERIFDKKTETRLETLPHCSC
jgi:hypothetical protein